MRNLHEIQPEDWVDLFGDYLFRYAFSRVKCRDAAEDIVQSTLLAAVASYSTYTGESSLRNWMAGILKHKLADHFRQSMREMATDPAELFSANGSGEFDGAGQWRAAISGWSISPLEAVSNKEFRRVLENCLEKIPPNQKAAFVLRDMEDMPAEDVCKTLQIKVDNLYVLLYRVRLRLRKCLEINWFSGMKD